MTRLQTRGLILRRQEFGESDRIVTILTESHGKVSGIAKGVRKLKSKLAAGIELFVESDFTLLRGKSSMMTVTSVKPITVFSHLTDDYGRLEMAASFLRDVNRLTEDEEGEELYSIVHGGLTALNNPAINETIAEAWFEMKFLSSFGHSPELKRDATGKSMTEQSEYIFSIEDGTFVQGKTEHAFTADDIKVWRLLAAADMSVVANVRGVDESLRKTGKILKSFYQFHLNI